MLAGAPVVLVAGGAAARSLNWSCGGAPGACVLVLTVTYTRVETSCFARVCRVCRVFASSETSCFRFLLAGFCLLLEAVRIFIEAVYFHQRTN